jgi:hypothetical protein
LVFGSVDFINPIARNFNFSEQSPAQCSCMDLSVNKIDTTQSVDKDLQEIPPK